MGGKREVKRLAGGLALKPIMSAVIVMFLTQWAMTQDVAYALRYQPELDGVIGHIGWHAIYEPFAWWRWNHNLGAYAPDQFERGLVICAIGVTLAFLAALVVSLRSSRLVREATTYGSARWATEQEIEKAALFDSHGVVLGKLDDGRYLVHNGPEHVEVTAPSRSQKGVSVVVPTLLTWRGSVLVHDIKGENWQLTAKHRAGMSYVLRFDPTSFATARFNPLLEVRQGPQEVKDVQNISTMLVDPDGKGKPDHWSKEGDNWLTALILHVLYAEPDKSLAGVARFMSDPKRTLEQIIQHMLTCPHLGNDVHPVVAMGARDMLNKSENERSGVHSTAKSFFSLYKDPIVAAATSESDFTCADLMQAEFPASLYLVSPPSDKDRLRPLMRLIIDTVLARLTEEFGGGDNKHKLLMLLDEFSSMGALRRVPNSAAYTAGYGIRYMLINQSVNQVIENYGASNTVFDSCHIHVWYAPNTGETAKRISDELGATTEVTQQKNYAGHRIAPWLGNIMVSDQETARPLMTPDEVRQLPSTDAIVMVAGLPPIYAKKCPYYLENVFKSRVPAIEPKTGKLTNPTHPYNPPVIPATRPYPFAPPAVKNAWLVLASQTKLGAVNPPAEIVPMRDLPPNEQALAQTVPVAAPTKAVEEQPNELTGSQRAFGLDQAETSGGLDQNIEWKF